MKHSNISYLECEMKIRQAYYGGRTEVFKPICNGRAFYYDVNSLYPASMVDNEFPVGYPEYIDNPKIAMHEWKYWFKYRDGLGFIKADVFVPDQTIPPLPCRMGKLVFVTGHITGSWTYNELAYAVENCGVIVNHVHEIIHFKNTYKVFRNFVMEFYKLKEYATEIKNNALRNFSKLILNTSYGWTGLNREGKTGLRDMNMIEKWQDTGRVLYTNEELGFFEIIDKVNATTVQVPVAAYVTSYARLILLDALRKQSEIGEVYYCDTDSIICSAEMPPEMVSKTRLGAWDLENVIDSGIFLQPKVYTYEIAGKDKIKFKGITKTRQKELDKDFYLEILKKLQNGEKEKVIVELGRQSLPTLAVAQKKHIDPNVLNVMDKGINVGAKQKRDIDYKNNVSKPWHMESREAFENFSFNDFNNPPDGLILFGG